MSSSKRSRLSSNEIEQILEEEDSDNDRLDLESSSSESSSNYSHTSFYELPLYETSELRNRFLEVTASTKNQQIL